MIELRWHDDNPPEGMRCWIVKDVNALVMTQDFPYESEIVELSTLEHKLVLLKLHNKHSDNMWSIDEYNEEVVNSHTDSVINSLLNSGCIITAKTPDKEFIIPTDLGKAVYSNITPVELSKLQMEFLAFVIENSEKVNLSEDYEDTDVEFRETGDPED